MTIKHLKPETAMPRPRAQMTDQLNSIKDRVQEHICKLVFFHETRPKVLASWLVSLNKHLRLLRLKNVGDKGRLNYTRQQLIEELDEYPIGVLEAGALEWSEASPPYPLVKVTDKTRKQCLVLLNKCIDCILSDSKSLTLADVEALGPGPEILVK